MIIPISWLVAFSVLTQEIAVVILIVLAYHSKNKTVGNVRTKKIKLKHRY